MSIEYREEPCRTALNAVRGMPFPWSLNPYMGCVHRCTFCYVRAFERRAERPSDDRYGRSIRVKTNVVDVLRRELCRPSWVREVVTVGAATDPYQPAEGRYRLTRGCLEAFAEHANPFELITRGPLVVRDRDVLADAAHRARVVIHVSVPTLDPDVWRTTEPGTAPPRARLRAVRMLAERGITVQVAMAPLLPGLSDDVNGMAEVVRAARDAGAAHIWGSVVYLRAGTREHFLAALARDWPDERKRYEALFRGRAYVERSVREATVERLRGLRRDHPERLVGAERIVPAPEAPRAAIQLGLGLLSPGVHAPPPTSAAGAGRLSRA